MKFTIKETAEIKNLTLLNSNGVDYTADFMDIASLDYVDRVDGDYVISQDDFDWWSDVIENQKILFSLTVDKGLTESEAAELFYREGLNHNDLDIAIDAKIEFLENI